MELALAFSLAVAAGAIGVAYGYRGQRDAALEQVGYLRRQLAESPRGRDDTAKEPTRLPVPHQGGGRS